MPYIINLGSGSEDEIIMGFIWTTSIITNQVLNLR